MSRAERHERLRDRGWRPVTRERVVGRVDIGGKVLPVIDGTDLVAWEHAMLAFPWPEADALQLEEERDKRNPDALFLLEAIGTGLGNWQAA